MLTAELKDSKLIITIDTQKPTPSASGKTLVVATSHGNMPTAIEIDGKPLIVGVNAYIRKA